MNSDHQQYNNIPPRARSIEDIVHDILRGMGTGSNTPSAYMYGWGNIPAPYQAISSSASSSAPKREIAALLDPSFSWKKADSQADMIPAPQIQDHAPKEKDGDTTGAVPADMIPAVFRGRAAKTAAHIFKEQPVMNESHPHDAQDETTASLAQTLPIPSDHDIPPIPQEALSDEAVCEIQKAIQKNRDSAPVEHVENDDPGYPGGIGDILSDPPADLPKQNGDTVSRVNHGHMARVLAARRAAADSAGHAAINQSNEQPLDLDLSAPNETPPTAEGKTKPRLGQSILNALMATAGIAAYGGASLLAHLRSSVSKLPLISGWGKKNDMMQSRAMNWRDTSYDKPSAIARAFNLAAKAAPVAGSFALSAGTGFAIKTGLVLALGATPVGLVAGGAAVAGGALTSLAVGGIKDMIKKRAAHRSDSFYTAPSGRKESRLMTHFKRATIGAAGGFIGFEFGDEIKEGLTSAFHSAADYIQNAGHAMKEIASSGLDMIRDMLPGSTDIDTATPAPTPATPAPVAAAVPDAPVVEEVPPAATPADKPEPPVEQPAPKQPPVQHHAQRPAAPAPQPATHAPEPTAMPPATEFPRVEVKEPTENVDVENSATNVSRPNVQFRATADGGIQVDVQGSTPNSYVQITADADGIQIVEGSGNHSGGGTGGTAGNAGNASDTERQTAWAGHDAYRQVFGYDSV